MPPRVPKPQSVARAVALFALTGFVVVALLGLAAVEVMRSTSSAEAVRDARELTDLAGRVVVAPAIRDGLLEGDPVAQRHLARVVERYVMRDPVVRVKIWTTTGRIVWSDERRLIGTQYTLRGGELAAARDGGVFAIVSDLDEPENRFERGYGRLIEVSRGITAPNGEHLLFETYQRSSVIEASGERIWRQFLPALVGALLALELVQIPLAYVLARRLRDGQRERSALLERAVDASDAERRAIATSLHDGPVQHLAGMAFSLAAASRSPGPPSDAMRTALGSAAAQTRTTIRDLRSTLVDLYPASLGRSGLSAAVRDLLAPLAEDGLETTCAIADHLDLPEEQEALLFRAAREALQNVRRHAGAGAVAVRVLQNDGTVLLEVEDDGCGFDPQGPGVTGHFGLRLVADLALAAGGRLDVESREGAGTTLRVELPA